MAALIEGRQVIWGISSDVKTTSDDILAGIVQSASVNQGGETAEIADEDGDFVGVVFHGYKNVIEITLVCTAASVALPTKGQEVVFSGMTPAITSIDGVDVSSGRAFIDDSSSSQTGTAVTEVSLTINHYPSMAADA